MRSIKNLHLDKADSMVKIIHFPIIVLAVLSISFASEEGIYPVEKLSNIDTTQYAVIKYENQYKIFEYATPAGVNGVS